MSMGRPIITTDAVGCRDTVVDGVNGKLIPVKSKSELIESMVWCLENTDKLSSMGIQEVKKLQKNGLAELINNQMLEAIGL